MTIVKRKVSIFIFNYNFLKKFFTFLSFFLEDFVLHLSGAKFGTEMVNVRRNGTCLMN